MNSIILFMGNFIGFLWSFIVFLLTILVYWFLIFISLQIIRVLMAFIVDLFKDTDFYYYLHKKFNKYFKKEKK